jgi:hypothetical protein
MPTPEELAADAQQLAHSEPSGSLASTVEQMLNKKRQLDAIEAQKSALQKEYDELRKVIVPRMLADEGLTGAKFPFGTLSLRHSMRASVPVERRAECREWCYANGHEDMLTVHASTVLGLANELVEQGQPVPDFISTYTEEVAVLTSTRKGA